MFTRIAFAAHGVPALVCSGVVVLAALVVPSVLAPARAGGALNLGCTGGYGAISCGAAWGPGGDPYVRTVPGPHSAEEQARYDARDRKWVEHCRPVIRQDRYGVARYHYAAPGCEFGVLGD